MTLPLKPDFDREFLRRQIEEKVDIGPEVQKILVGGSWANPDKRPTMDSDVDVYIIVEVGEVPTVHDADFQATMKPHDGDPYGDFDVHLMTNAPGVDIMTHDPEGETIPIYEKITTDTGEFSPCPACEIIGFPADTWVGEIRPENRLMSCDNDDCRVDEYRKISKA